jgi:dienelactone hydrolase
VVLGGAEGGAPVERAVWLASHGYAALALAYFGYDGGPGELEHIPLEYFGQALAWISLRPEVAPGKLAVIGISRGAELALQLGSIYPDIKAVVAYVPANVRYPSCCGRWMTAAWTLNGEGLAFATPQRYGVIPAIRQPDAAEIQVERTHGSILLISGEQDGVWPSSIMSEDLIGRLKSSRFAYRYEWLDYARAGHRAGSPEIVPAWTGRLVQRRTGEPEELGGTERGNAESGMDAGPKVLRFLDQAFANVAP